MNNVNLIGRITKDPEGKNTAQGTLYVKFTVAVNRQFKDKNTNEYVTDFINCVAWGHSATFICDYIKKGNLIAISGNIQTGSYEKDGAKIYTTEVFVERVQSLEKKEENDSLTVKEQKNVDKITPRSFMDSNADDLPF